MFGKFDQLLKEFFILEKPETKVYRLGLVITYSVSVKEKSVSEGIF